MATAMDNNGDGNGSQGTSMAKVIDVNGDGNGCQQRWQWTAMKNNGRQWASIDVNATLMSIDVH